MTPDTGDATFETLPRQQRLRIDSIFDKIVGLDSIQQRPRKMRKIDSAVEPGGFVIEEAGGFIPEDDNEPGGFLVDGDDTDDEADISNAAEDHHIPLSSIPHALQLLGLPPDDEETLAVFRQAASGWGAQANEEGVGRKDWRAVCSVLLEQEMDGVVDASEHQEIDSDDGEDSDDYRMSDDDLGESSASEDEYLESVVSSSRRTRKSRASKSSRADVDESDIEDTSQLNSHRKRECREAFALLFPDVADTDLDRTRIMIKDISRVAKLLKEKISVEEIIEMLEAFSSSPDKSMNLSDFERMMVAAKLV